MLRSLVKNLIRPREAARGYTSAADRPLRLHIGGQVPDPDWKIVDAVAAPHVDYVRSCADLSVFGNSSVTEIYASHVLEHLGYQAELSSALREFYRVLEPGGVLRISVPDLATLCSLFVDPALDDAERFHVMRMMFGGQLDSFDFHRVGLTQEFLARYVANAGFEDIQRVANFALFDDTSALVFRGRPVSLNVVARKPRA
jgi:predicted SAM-dependent methyltransferase